MSEQTHSGLRYTNLKPKIGSEVKVDAKALTSGAFAKELRALLVERGVLVLRDLDITLDQQRDLTATLGRLRTLGGALQKVTLDPKESPEYSAFFPTTFFWHMDGAYDQKVPGFAATLRPARLSSQGGQTEFLNAFAVYDDLPDNEKHFIDGLRAVHSRLATMTRATPDATDEEIARWRRTPPATQPLVWEHQSGRKSLMLGNSVSHIEGMHPADSDDVLRRLRSHMAQAQYVYTHEWRMNDLVLWHNTGTMHRVRPFDPRSGRLLNRFSLDGEEPIRAPGK
jgi:alpha-ketoglutarate-dependent taurine dioxygenase